MQLPLIDLLLERGAAIDGARPGRSYVRDALANGCPEAAWALADRGAYPQMMEQIEKVRRRVGHG